MVKEVVTETLPSNVKQLHSFLRLLNYYGRFLSKLSFIVVPLNALLQKDAVLKRDS